MKPALEKARPAGPGSKAEAAKAREAPGSTKARILMAAQEIFAARGFDGASTREIAARAGVNISSLHYHWDSKETLYFAIFEGIYQQLGDLLAGVVVKPDSAAGARTLISEAIGLIFDYYAANPTVPKLLMRRIMETDGKQEPDDVMGPSWRMFARWTNDYAGHRVPERDVSFFMLAVQCVLLVLMIDSPYVSAMLGESVTDPEVRGRLRQQAIELVERLVGVETVEREKSK